MSRRQYFSIALMLFSMGLLGAADPPKPREGDLKVGDAAPAFELKQLGAEKPVKLADLKGKPVLLVFGSCTWPPFRKAIGAIEKLAKDYDGRIHLYVVYIREAHPTDGRQVPQNEKDKVLVKDPTTNAERHKVAEDFAKQFKLKLPILLDTIDDKMEKSYAGWPDRLYVVDGAGKIAYKGGPGPRGFKPDEIPTMLDKLLKK